MNAIINKPKGDKMSSNFEGKPIDEFKPGDIITMVGPGVSPEGNNDYFLIGKKLKLRAIKNGLIYLKKMDPEYWDRNGLCMCSVGIRSTTLSK